MDIIITTALIPGKKAPILITKAMVDSMRQGSVIVDLAAEAGGNCEVTQPGKSYVYNGSVTVIGYTDLPSRLPTQSSTLYANNITKLLLSMGTTDNRLVTDLTDDVVRMSMVTHEGAVTWPPAPIQAPPAAAAASKVEKKKLTPAEQRTADEAKARSTVMRRAMGTTIPMASLIALGAVAPNADFATQLSIFTLSGIVGYQVVWGVTPALHSPLMSVTNAVSGITAVGGLVLMGGDYLPSTSTQALAASAVVISSINVVGGFNMTRRMLDMFRRKDDLPEFNHYWAIPAASIPVAYLTAMNTGYDSPTLHSMAGLAASTMCIGAIGGLSSQSSARMGNWLGMIGVGTGIMSTLGASGASPAVMTQMGGALFSGGLIGAVISQRVQITELPQLVAAFHSFVGLAAAGTSFASYLHSHSPEHMPALITDPALSVQLSSEWAGNVIGSITFTGSLVAFAKLQGLVDSKPLRFAGQHYVNATMAMGNVAALGVMLNSATSPDPSTGLAAMGVSAALSSALGYTLTAGVGGADVPLMITLLNSYSGWALCAEGFMLNNPMLTTVGALVGSSGWFWWLDVAGMTAVSATLTPLYNSWRCS